MADITIKWIGQSGYIISDETTKLCIDPYLSDAVNRIAKRERMVKAPLLPQDLRSDAVICSHDHPDHTDIDAIPLMNKENMIFLAPSHARNTLLSCGVTRFLPFDENDVYTVGDFKLTAVFADHTVPAIGILIEHGEYTLYFSGDTEYNSRLCELADKNIDVMFICINGKLGNMNVDDAARLTRIIAPRIGVPNHYGMFESNSEDPQKYISQIKNGFILKHNVEYTIKEILDYV